MFKAIKNLFSDRQNKVEFLAAHIFIRLVRNRDCPPSVASRAAFDYAETFMRESEKRKKRNEIL